MMILKAQGQIIAELCEKTAQLQKNARLQKIAATGIYSAESLKRVSAAFETAGLGHIFWRNIDGVVQDGLEKRAKCSGLPEKYAELYNPFSWGAMYRARNLDKKIDDYNANLWEKYPSGYDNNNNPILVNRGSTYVRNGQPFKINTNVPPRLRTTVIDMYDAMHKHDVQHGRDMLPPPLPSVGMTADNKEYLGKYNTNEAMWGPLLPFSRSIRLTPSADTDTILHEGGHQRDYRTKHPFAWFRDVYLGGFVSSMTNRLENKADTIGRELDRLIHPDSKAKNWLHGQR